MNTAKPILIDALHINMGGALMILNHLIDHLVARDINFVLLKDNRCPVLRSEGMIKTKVIMSCDERSRKQYYKGHRADFRAVLCLGNIPPAIRMPVPVHTYIHNVNLIEIPLHYTFPVKMGTLLKRQYIRYYAKNTNTWIVQTSHTANIVSKFLPCKGKPVLEYPFYYIPDNMNQTPCEERSDYVFVGEETGAKGMTYLIEAWKILSRSNFNKTLHLTTIAPELQDQIKEAIAMGAKIENHGRLGFEDIITLYNCSKAIIYPSLNESLGLGIVEAAAAGCDVIGSDLPYLHAVCKPTLTFQPRNAQSIANAVLVYETGGQSQTTIKIKDLVEEFIDFILR